MGGTIWYKIWERIIFGIIPKKSTASHKKEIFYLVVKSNIPNDDNPKKSGKIYKRSWGMVACVKRAIDEGVPIMNPKWCEHATRRDVENIFRPEDGFGEIPLLEERHFGLNQLGKYINTKVCFHSTLF